MGQACCGSEKQPPPIHYSPPVTPQYEIPKPKTPLIRREYSAMQRFSKVGISTSNPLTFIKGYLDEPLVSLEEALEPFDGRIDELSDYIIEAKTKCFFPSPHNLTRDESAAIYIYTMKWGDGCLYDHLQAAWKFEDSTRLRPWFKYLKLFRTALDKLPNANTEVWQGTTYNEQLKEQLSAKSASLYSSMGSCCQSEKELKEYLGKHGDEKMILIGYESVDGKSITGYTAGNSKEVMVWPGMKLGVATYTISDANGSVTFHMVKSKKAPEPIKPVILEKHFVCRNKNCTNRCRGNHDTNHCYGFAYVYHTCQHHCGPPHACIECGKHIADLRECNKCQDRYCESCSFK